MLEVLEQRTLLAVSGACLGIELEIGSDNTADIITITNTGTNINVFDDVAAVNHIAGSPFNIGATNASQIRIILNDGDDTLNFDADTLDDQVGFSSSVQGILVIGSDGDNTIQINADLTDGTQAPIPVTILGGAGNDSIVGNAGDESLTGGLGPTLP